ncbi:MAG TPA: tRNA (adenosine(37)-N6)-threonylcarbamoyltransferase complex dimerization subunit type 1 TsaB [Pirellulales bacterium]
MALRILALETSGRSGSVAVLDGAQPLVQVELEPTQRSAQALAPAIARVLTEAGWQPRQVELVAVTAGPGSFTGLRVGVTTAKSFAWATGAAVLGVDTLEVIARQALDDGALAPETPVAVALEAERDEIFAAVYGPARGAVLHAPAIVASQAWLATLEPGWRVTGPALGRLASQVPAQVEIVASSRWFPTAAAVGQLAAWRFQCGQHDDVWQLVPRYFRRSAAEEKWEAARLRLKSTGTTDGP